MKRNSAQEFKMLLVFESFILYLKRNRLVSVSAAFIATGLGFPDPVAMNAAFD